MGFSKMCVCKFKKHSKDNNSSYISEFIKVLNRLMTLAYHCI